MRRQRATGEQQSLRARITSTNANMLKGVEKLPADRGIDHSFCSLRDSDISEIDCDKVREAAAAASTATTLLDLKGNCLLRDFRGLDRLFPGLQTLVLSDNVLGESLPTAAESWAAALARAAPPSLQRLNIAKNGLVHIPWDDLATLCLFEIVLDNNKLTTLGCPSSSPCSTYASSAQSTQKAAQLSRSLRSLSVAGNRLASLRGIGSICPNLDSLDLRDNLVASARQLEPLQHLKDTLQSIRLDGNPCMTGEFCIESCLRAKLLLEWTTKVVLLNGIQIPSKPHLRKAFCNYVGNTNMSTRKACPCGLLTLEYEPLVLEETTSLVAETESIKNKDIGMEEQAKVGKDQRVKSDANPMPVVEIENLDQINMSATSDPVVNQAQALKVEVEQDQTNNSTSYDNNTDVGETEGELNLELLASGKERPESSTDVQVVKIPNSHKTPSKHLPATLPQIQDVPTMLKSKIKISIPSRPADASTAAAATAPSPRKQKTIAFSSITPFAENKGASFLSLDMDRRDRSGIWGIGTGGAMPFRKLGQRRVPRPVQRGYDPLEGSSWLSEMLEKASKSNKKKKERQGTRKNRGRLLAC